MFKATPSAFGVVTSLMAAVQPKQVVHATIAPHPGLVAT
jgi:hypothetical protein